MNILPLIFTFLIIFSCIAFTFLREIKSFHLAETTFESFKVIERKMNNFIVKKAYQKVKGDPTDKKEKPKAQGQEKTYLSKRCFFPPLENSKFNLGPLVKQEGEFKSHPLFELSAEILRLLYKEKIFDRAPHSKNIEYHLLEAIVTKARKNPECEDLSELLPDDLALHSIYYKMLKGTNRYTRKEGIPPLKDFLALRKEGAAICLCFASPALLQALFGEGIATHILEEEQKKWAELSQYHYFSKENLQELLSKDPSLGSKYSRLESYVDYSKQIKKRKEIGCKDQKTGLSIKKSIK